MLQAQLLQEISCDKKCSLELYIIRIKDHISPLQRNAILFFSCTGIVIYCFGKLSMNTIPSVLTVNNQIGAAALIRLRRLLIFLCHRLGVYLTAAFNRVAALIDHLR